MVASHIEKRVHLMECPIAALWNTNLALCIFGSTIEEENNEHAIITRI